MRLTKGEYRLLDQTALQLRLDYDFLVDDLDVFQLANKMNVSLIPYSEIEDKAKKFIFDKEDRINDGFLLQNVESMHLKSSTMIKFRIRELNLLSLMN